MAFGVFQLRRDTAANWVSANPVLAAGELALEIDSGRIKVGNGTAAWTALSYVDAVVTASTQTGNYTVVLADAGTVVQMNVAGPSTLTIPPNSSVAFPLGTVIEVAQWGAGAVTVTPGAGVSFVSKGAKRVSNGQYGVSAWRQVSTDLWHGVGDLA